MNRATRFFARAALACGALLTAAAPASAEPLLRATASQAAAGSTNAAAATTAATAIVPAAVQRQLAEQVRVARAANPQVFAQVTHLNSLQPRVYRASRIRRPTV